MNRQQIIDHYQEQIKEAETDFERAMLERECQHKIKLFDQGINPDEDRKNNNIACVGCGS